MMKRCLILPVFLAAAALAFAQDPPELRAFYAPVFDVNTQTACDNVIAAALSRNVNAVFVEIRGRADAYYYPNREDSTYPNTEPRGQLYAISPASLDVLQYFIDRLHAASPRVEVHAWLTTYNSWNRSTPPASPLHVYNAHPEWITENQAGVTYTYANDAPLDPGIPAVQDHLYNVFMDVVRNYDVDGVHFDYVRLLSADSGYDPVAKARFLADTGWNYDTQNPAGQLDEVYKAWRRDQISQLVQRVYARTMLEKTWVEVSAFTVHFADPIDTLGQGYNWWVAHGAIDVIHPSVYSSSITTAESHWNTFVSRLAPNDDQYTRPLVAAVADYLLLGPEPHYSDRLVTQLRSNSRVPDGFNFFAYAALFEDGTPPTEHADRIFNSGGPMDGWAPVPAIAHKTDEETTPPNAPAALSAALVSGVPRVTFNRPAAAADGDLPVHYRLYRYTSSPVRRYYADMVMEWWDLASSRASFSFDDVAAPSGTYYYAAVAYDNWNNEALSATGPVTVSAGADIIIDDGDAGFTTTGSWASSTGGDSYNGDYVWASTGGTLSTARWTPTMPAAGNYQVFVWYRAGSNRASDAPYTVYYNGGNITIPVDQKVNSGQWNSLGTYSFAAGSSGYVQLSDNAEPSTVVVADAVRFLAQTASPTPKEPKPPVVEPSSGITEVIVDSEPTSLDYDDKGSWTTTSYSPSGTLYNGSARYFGAGSYPMNDYAVWVANLPQAGKWAIEGWIRSEQGSLARGVQYRFVDGSGTAHSSVATQQPNPGMNGWYINVDGVDDTGAYNFNKGRVYVTLYGNTTGSEVILADALRFRLIQPAVSNWEVY